MIIISNNYKGNLYHPIEKLRYTGYANKIRNNDIMFFLTFLHRIALNVSAKTRKPLMTHHAESTIPTDQMTGIL